MCLLTDWLLHAELPSVRPCLRGTPSLTLPERVLMPPGVV